MIINKVPEVIYEFGNEKKIKRLLYKSKEPILLKMVNFTDKFSIDFFIEQSRGLTTYSVFDNSQFVEHKTGDITSVLKDIKNNKPYRIFGQYYPRWMCEEVEKQVPLWQDIPFRPRFCNKMVKTLFFLGGKGSNTGMHYDREYPSILHLCLSGKKRLLLFTKKQNDFLYKTPFVGDSLIDFSKPIEEIYKQFPNLKKAQGYEVVLEKGDMLFMPKKCWHYTEYIDASAAATYVFYPNKLDQLYGSFTGLFYLGYKENSGFQICNWPFFKKFDLLYARSSGVNKFFLKVVEKILFIFLLPAVSVSAYISHKIRPRKCY
ncbi:cupin-like domain-containing protein [Legionella waltersii]|uniref:Eukaryotic small stress protein PASS1 n=1 Tax=Legionella waltersii TaxID=66969 RepID=A0A0W1AD74_9GAMM|nr:cupin-like domain-containing protein [Legionella waltersii]KTD79255.1 eukaryotic small stress protein PASS1 [Legionella waltersii]SNV12741.1 eukaryotic small stress protein [Legionella waltersii]